MNWREQARLLTRLFSVDRILSRRPSAHMLRERWAYTRILKRIPTSNAVQLKNGPNN